MSLRRLLVLVPVLGLAAFAACGGDDDDVVGAVAHHLHRLGEPGHGERPPG